jgi:hypothetical protein
MPFDCHGRAVHATARVHPASIRHRLEKPEILAGIEKARL